MWRYSIFECIQKESELFLCLFRRKSKYFEHLGLNIILVDSDTSATDLISVQYDIVCLSTYCSRIAVDLIEVFFHRHGKRMMHGNETILFFGPLKQWELRNPQETEIVFFQQIQTLCQMQTQCTEHIPNNFFLVRSKQQQVSRFSVHCFYQFF